MKRQKVDTAPEGMQEEVEVPFLGQLSLLPSLPLDILFYVSQRLLFPKLPLRVALTRSSPS